jgi:peptidoglycan hydrolase CwlO-like protein
LKKLIVLVILSTGPALAQQPPPDPVAASYAQLLGKANSRVANLNGALQQANAKIADLQKQIDAAKPKDAPK